MEEPTSLPEPTGLFVEALMQVLCPTFDINSIDGSNQEILKNVINSSISSLKISKQLSGIVGNNATIEKWLLDVLREVYKRSPNAFSTNAITELKSISTHPQKRKWVITEYQYDQTGYVIGDDFTLVHVFAEAGGHYGRKLGAVTCYETKEKYDAYLVNHKKYLSQIVAVYDAIDVSIAPVKVAHLLIEKIAYFKEKTLRENFSSFREKHNLPEAELREANHKRHRVTHCYNCKGHLETGIFWECSKCNWLVCNCGACGCGFTRGESEHSDEEHDVGSGKGDYEGGDEHRLLLKELFDENRLYAQSKNDGWFYDDDDRKKRNDY